MTKTIETLAANPTQVEALDAILTVLAARPLAAPAWVAAACRARLNLALAVEAGAPAPDRRAA